MASRSRASLFLASLLSVVGLLAVSSGSALAQDDMSMQSPSQTSGIGVGVESMLSGPSGPTVVYQAASFHAEGIVGVFDRANTAVLIAGRFYYQVHSGELSDFSVGGGLGLLNFDGPGPGDNETDLHLEAGAKIRVFLAPNVALSSSLGLALVADEGPDTAEITGRLQGTMGIAYFFF